MGMSTENRQRRLVLQAGESFGPLGCWQAVGNEQQLPWAGGTNP